MADSRARSRIIPIFIPHLGCPCDCVFCNQRSIAAQRAPDMAETERLIAEGVSRAGTGAELAFFGGSFTAIDRDMQESYLSVADRFLADGRLGSVRVSTRPDCIDSETVRRLKRHGVSTIELGAQSMEDSVLLASNRGHTARDTVEASGIIRAEGVTLVLQMMTGLPGEDGGSPMRTALAIADCKPDFVRIYPTAVIRGTRLEEMWRSGEYTPLDTMEAVKTCAELIERFEGRGIGVIRVGLNPTDSLGGEVVAGVYHPAFGELCRQEIYLKRARELLLRYDIPAGSAIQVTVGRGRTSMFIGQKRRNSLLLTEEFGLRDIRVSEGDLPGYELSIEIMPNNGKTD